MAFNDMPIIDSSSRNSEKSELALRNLFTQEAGFVCRQEVPDKGCDFDVELILEGANASNWRFPIQLKSVESLYLVENGKYISYSFETSRLGYLMRRITSMGVVVLYSMEQEKCFFEYADKIYSRLMEERESEEWKQNEKVSIHIPYDNVLSKDSVNSVHTIFLSRFEKGMIMQNSHGPKYGLPVIDFKGKFEYDFNNLDHIKKFLREHGQSLIRNYDIDMVFQMIVQVPNIDIYRDKELLLVAAVAFSETGHNSDSEIFWSKLKKQTLDDSENVMIEYIHLKNQFALGYIGNSEFLTALKDFSSKELDKRNRLTLNVNIIRFELRTQKVFNSIPDALQVSIDQVFEDTRETELDPRSKDLLLLWNCENLVHLASSIMGSSLGEIQMKERLKGEALIPERVLAKEKTFRMQSQIASIIKEVQRAARERDDKLVSATVAALDIRNFLVTQTNLIAFDAPMDLKDSRTISSRVSNAALAFDTFGKLNLFAEAYDSLCNLIELIELCDNVYSLEHKHSKPSLYDTKSQLEKDFELPARDIAVVSLLHSKRNPQLERPLYFCKDMDDDQIVSMATTVLNSLNLSDKNLINIIKELEAYRMFYQRCSDDSIEVIQVKTLRDYSLPLAFCLKSKRTGLQTLASRDMDALLTAWGY